MHGITAHYSASRHTFLIGFILIYSIALKPTEGHPIHLLIFMFDFYLLVFRVWKTSDFWPPFAHLVQNSVTPGHTRARVGSLNFSLRMAYVWNLNAVAVQSDTFSILCREGDWTLSRAASSMTISLLSHPNISFYNFIQCVFHPNTWWRNHSHTVLTVNHQVLLRQLISRISQIWGSYDWCRLTSCNILLDYGWTGNVTPLKLLSLLRVLW